MVSCMLTVDNFLTNELEPLKPHKSTFNLAKPYDTSSNLSIPKPVIASISHWINEDYSKTALDPRKVALTNALPDAP